MSRATPDERHRMDKSYSVLAQRYKPAKSKFLMTKNKFFGGNLFK